MIYIVLDIETIADPAAVACLDPIKADGRLKDPVKVEADISEKTLERYDQMALHPDTCLCVAIGYHIVGREDPTCLLMRDAFEEANMIRQVADVYRDLNKRNEVRFVTFNGLFDLPVLMSRAMYLDVEFPDLNIDKFSDHSHLKYDVWWKLSRKGAIKAKSLRFYAQRLGFGTLDKVNGNEIAHLVKTEDWNAVEAHCLSDVGLTHSIANRLGMLKL